MICPRCKETLVVKKIEDYDIWLAQWSIDSAGLTSCRRSFRSVCAHHDILGMEGSILDLLGPRSLYPRYAGCGRLCLVLELLEPARVEFVAPWRVQIEIDTYHHPDSDTPVPLSL